MNDLKDLLKEVEEVRGKSEGLTCDNVLRLMMIDRMDTLNRRLFELKELLRARM